MQSKVKGQVIVVTGASKGIGFATAQVLASRGARVALLARGEAGLQEAAAQLPADQVFTAAVDVCDKAGVEKALDAVIAKWGRIDGIINNAGFQFARRIELMPEAEVRKMVDVNFLATVFACQLAIPRLRKTGGGRIVNISSATVRHDNEFAHLALYSASKAAMDKFSQELREEVKKDGVLVTVFSPGAVATGSIANFDPAALPEAMGAWLEKGPKFDGMTTADVIGEAIAGCFEFPAGVAVEFMEVRPQMLTPKLLENEVK
ncbi:SDR family oxidoreductase [Solimonas sp. K1W22B-7]|uniref:SDR family oxidoreductase n=1 Tax=Solimonas sp. K1W22B-7 TaxID=2303331 RepID=UPI000E33204E|nr:SDR family oxidoreductase [Solimonas sp. K1W22B-7]AXQ28152.1 SDR family oxidoreductase [Solimonas sp. K1W22B-7]